MAFFIIACYQKEMFEDLGLFQQLLRSRIPKAVISKDYTLLIQKKMV